MIPGGEDELMWWWHDGADGGEVWVMGFTMLLLWVPLIAAVAWALRSVAAPDHSGRDASGGDDRPDPRDLARERYARGELERQRFLEIMDDLDRTARLGGRAGDPRHTS